MGQGIIAEGHIYEASVEVAEYMAEYSYLEKGSEYIPYIKFEEYLDSKELVSTHIKGGVSGVSFFGTSSADEDGYIILRVNYQKTVNLPFLPNFTQTKTFEIKQKAYIGYVNSEDSSNESDNKYVYVTDNKDVFHNTRSCTHLDLSVTPSTLSDSIAAGYMPCECCSNKNSDFVIVTDYGSKYHMDVSCGGIKRTIYRVKRNDVKSLGGCSRCAN